MNLVGSSIYGDSGVITEKMSYIKVSVDTGSTEPKDMYIVYFILNSLMVLCIHSGS